LNLLFDASSIAGILSKKRGAAINILVEQSTLDLAIYELGNVLWKESRVNKRTESETSTLVGYIRQVLGVMEMQRVQLDDILDIELNAVKFALTFYDASYLTIAKKCNRILVTEDKQLQRASKEANIDCIRAEEVSYPSLKR